MVELTARIALESMMRATEDDATPIIRRLARVQARAILDGKVASDTGAGLLREAIAALRPFAGHVGKRGETLRLEWGRDHWTGTLTPENFYAASDIVRRFHALAANAKDKAEECPDCKRRVLTDNRSATGFLATCGRRLASIDQCRPGGCATPTYATDGEARYLIRKGGYYYRPNAHGYTSHKAEAGRYTLAEAVRHSHPNGPDGPRDGMDYVLDTDATDGATGGEEVREPQPYVCLNPDAEDIRLMLEGAVARCPCCEGTPSTFARLFPHSGIFQAHVSCTRCHMQVLYNARDLNEARAGALAAWSTRPTLTTTPGGDLLEQAGDDAL